MELTGKAKQQFEGWYLKLPNAIGVNYGASDITMNRFYCLPQSMQWGVFQDWADSIGYYITITCLGHSHDFSSDITTDDDSILWENEYKTRQEARDAAIAKLNEIINNQ